MFEAVWQLEAGQAYFQTLVRYFVMKYPMQVKERSHSLWFGSAFEPAKKGHMLRHVVFCE